MGNWFGSLVSRVKESRVASVVLSAIQTNKWIQVVVLPIALSCLVILLCLSTRAPSFLLGDARSTAKTAAVLYRDATWQYGSHTDSMRGETKKWAELYSPTDLNLQPPYDGPNSAHLLVFDGTATLVVQKGQFVCHDDTIIYVKFDNDPVKWFTCEMSDNGDTTFLVIRPLSFHHSDLRPDTLERMGWNANVIDRLHSTKKMIVEVEFFGSGSRQLTFNVKGLDESKIQ